MLPQRFSAAARRALLPIPRTIAAGLLLAAVPAFGAADLEGKMYVITDWISECSGNDVDAWAEMLDGWYDHVNDYGKVFKDGRMVNGDMNAAIFCDPDTHSDCSDHTRADDADALMIGLHGGDRGSYWGGLMRRTGPNGVCRAEGAYSGAPAGTPLVRLGDKDVEYFHMSSCESMNDEHWSNTRRMMYDSDSSSNGARAHIATGFHGLMWISSGRDDDYEDFALDAHFAMAWAWTEHLYDDDIGDDDVEQCPVAMSIGPNLDNCLARLNSEAYLLTQSDPTSSSYYCAMYYDGCDPAAESPLAP